jgi:hypothetical protein
MSPSSASILLTTVLSIMTVSLALLLAGLN